jgi:hypothetical protein
MKNIVFSMFAIALAGIAAIAATTAMLNAPVAQHIGPPASDKPAEPGTPPATPPESPPGTPAPSGDKPATPAPQSPAPEAGKPAGEAGKDEEIVADEDPYEGIAPEDLPPDLQYDADSSVSFPTNI